MQIVPRTRATLQVNSETPRNISGENMTRPGDVKKCPKNRQNWKLQYIIWDFLEAWALNTAGCLLGPWEFIGKESCGLEWIYGCLYIHFEPILDFMRNEQIGCSVDFQANANGVKHTRNVTSHVGTPRNVSGENMTRPEKVQKCRENSQNWRL